MQFGIEAISAIGNSLGATPGAASSAAPAAGFEQLMSQGIGQVNSDIAEAEAGLSALARGESVELHQVMISMEKARISAMALIQVRNKLVEAYQELTRMQV